MDGEGDEGSSGSWETASGAGEEEGEPGGDERD